MAQAVDGEGEVIWAGHKDVGAVQGGMVRICQMHLVARHVLPVAHPPPRPIGRQTGQVRVVRCPWIHVDGVEAHLKIRATAAKEKAAVGQFHQFGDIAKAGQCFRT